jgi:outer membrane protein OmpA-like peptidoglycan-associated protein
LGYKGFRIIGLRFGTDGYDVGRVETEEKMMNICRRITAFVSIALLFAAAGCAGVPDNAPRNKSGTYSIAYDSVGTIFGFYSGNGKMTLDDGSEYAISAAGYGMVGIGYSIASAKGNVYNLKVPSDIAGEYGALGGVAVVGSGSLKTGLKNQGNDVILDIESDEMGMRIGLGGGFTTFKLGKMLKGPRVVAKPKPAPKPAPVMKPKKMSHEIEFGFNKSRVNLATQKLLDGIVADWKNAKVSFDIVGHADTVGSSTYNKKLSSARADNIKKALIERGIPAARITAAGVGEKNLAVPTPNQKRLRANRRVIITIRKMN